MSNLFEFFRSRFQLSTTARLASIAHGVLLLVAAGPALADLYEQELTPSLSGRDFGIGVSIADGRVAVGDSNENFVSIFEPGLDGVLMEEVSVIVGPEDGLNFGWSVSLDGDRLAVGDAHRNDGLIGVVYVYYRDSFGVWIEEAVLEPPDGTGDANFGFCVELEGDRLLIGAPKQGFDSSGAVYVYDWIDDAWTLSDTITAADPDELDWFGVSVQLLGDRAVIGSPWWDGAYTDQGAIYEFERDPNSGDWQQVERITADDPDEEELAWSVAMDDTGDRLVAGTSLYTLGGGRAVVFEKQEGSWVQTYVLESPDPMIQQGYGHSVAFDGDLILVGAPGWLSSACLYRWTEPHWSLVEIATDGGDFFGWNVDLHEGLMVVGDPTDPTHGATYFYSSGRTLSGCVTLMQEDGDDCIPVGPGLEGRRVRCESATTDLDWVATTDENGEFEVNVIFDTYTVSLLPKEYWEQSCPTDPLTYTATVEVAGPTRLYFGSRPIPNIKDLRVSVAPDREPRPGFLYNYIVTGRNVGTEPQTADLSLELPPEVTYFSASDGGTLNGLVVSWDPTLLEPGDEIRRLVYVNVPVATPLGTELTATATIDPVEMDADPVDNVDTDVAVVVGSYDPNDKAVHPEGNIAVDQTLSYRIRFQNVGTAEAFNVVVRDTLDTNLDISTLDIQAVSHDYVFDIVGRELVFVFDDINLPDSTSNEPESHGAIEFEIQPLSDLVPGETIWNRAGIYFDFNPVVLTNLVQSTIENTVAVEATTRGAETVRLVVDGNPVRGPIGLQLDLPASGRLVLDLVGVDGRRIATMVDQSMPEGKKQLTWSPEVEIGRKLPAGVYFIEGGLASPSGVTPIRGRLVQLE